MKPEIVQIYKLLGLCSVLWLVPIVAGLLLATFQLGVWPADGSSPDPETIGLAWLQWFNIVGLPIATLSFAFWFVLSAVEFRTLKPYRQTVGFWLCPMIFLFVLWGFLCYPRSILWLVD